MRMEKFVFEELPEANSIVELRKYVRSLSLGIGEQAALTLIQNYPDAIFLADYAAARLAADRVNAGYREFKGYSPYISVMSLRN